MEMVVLGGGGRKVGGGDHPADADGVLASCDDDGRHSHSSCLQSASSHQCEETKLWGG